MAKANRCMTDRVVFLENTLVSSESISWAPSNLARRMLTMPEIWISRMLKHPRDSFLMRHPSSSYASTSWIYSAVQSLAQRWWSGGTGFGGGVNERRSLMLRFREKAQ